MEMFESQACHWLGGIIILVPFKRSLSSVESFLWRFQQGCIFSGTSCPWFGSPASCAVASRKSWIMLVIAWYLLVILCICTMGGLLSSSGGPSLDKQFASRQVYPLMDFTLKSYGMVLTNKHLVLVLLVSNFWQEYFLCLLVCLKVTSFAKQGVIKFLHGPSNCKWFKLNCNIFLLLWLVTLTSNVNWVAFLQESCTKTLEACIYLQAKRFADVILFQKGCTGDFLFIASNASVCFKVHTNSAFFLVSYTTVTKVWQSWRVFLG